MLLKMEHKLDALEKHNVLLIDMIVKQSTINSASIKGKEVTLPGPTLSKMPENVVPVVEIKPPAISTVLSNSPIITPAGPNNKPQSIKAFGVLKDASGKVLHGIPIAIVDAKTNTAVKTTKTNRAGEFISFLPVGKYIAVATFENNQQRFKPFDIIHGMKDMEVSIV